MLGEDLEAPQNAFDMHFTEQRAAVSTSREVGNTHQVLNLSLSGHMIPRTYANKAHQKVRFF